MGLHALFLVLLGLLALLGLFGLLFTTTHVKNDGVSYTPTRRIHSTIEGGGFSLVGEIGAWRGRVIPLSHVQIKIGRAKDNEIVVDAQTVSRYHAILMYGPDGFRVIDQDSTNGVWVNHKRVASYLLNNNDLLQIGPVVFRYVVTGAVPTVAQSNFTKSRTVQESELTERFRLQDYELSRIQGGRGGQAEVFKAIPHDGGRPLAVKMFTNPDPYTVQKFQQVVRQVIALKHPHIISLYDYGRSPDGKLYLVMEFLSGGSLRDRLRKGLLPLGRTLAIVGQMCEALSYAHHQGILHRDVKPENILFDAANSAKLIDFSAAHFSAERTVTQDGMLIGTPYYMSYEQAMGENAVPASDIYSLGVVLFEMTTGRHPFEGDALSVIDQHIKAMPPDPQSINHAIPSYVRDAILVALAKDKRRRFQTAEQFARALRIAISENGKTGQRRLQYSSARQRIEVVLLVSLTGDRIVVMNTSVLGRSEINKDDKLISHKHIRISMNGKEVTITDYRSRNGTFVNGVRLTSQRFLHDGDIVRVGRTDLEIRIRSVPV